jgi:GGDEF domain-containing protein
VRTLRPGDARAFAADLDLLMDGKIAQVERHVILGERAVLIRASASGEGAQARLSGVVVDVTEPFLRDKASQLPAEGALLDRLATHRAQGHAASIVAFDVRRFDELTLAHGILRADDALQIYIAAVHRVVEPVGELFRTGALEFAVLFRSGLGAARRLAREIASGDQFGVQIGDGQIHRVASAVGIVLDSVETPAETRFRAKLALKAAVEAGAGNVREYSEELLASRLRQARIES